MEHRAGLTAEDSLDDGRQCCERSPEVLGVEWRDAIGMLICRSDRLEELSHGNAESAGKADQYVCAGIRLRQFQPPNVFVVKAGEFGQALLRQSALEAQPAQLSAKRP
jgi:hypothetical protein